MADIKSPTERYKAIADAIREKNGTTELMHPADMPQAILDIVGGGGGDITIGADYTDIVYNEDNTITLTDKDGVEHTMSCTYEDDKLIGVTYDGKKVELTYDGDVLVKVGKTEIDMTSVPLAKVEIANADLTVSPIVKAIADIEPSGNVLIQRKGLVKRSCTPNVVDGVQNGSYPNSYSKTEVITIEGSSGLEVTIKWGTEGINYDWVSVYAGNHPDYTAGTSGALGTFGGTDGEKTFTIEGDSVTFAFRSDSSGTGSGYGYYATVTGLTFDEGATQETYTIQDGDT